MNRIVVVGLVACLGTGLQAQSVARPVVNPIDDTSIYPIAVWAMPSQTAADFARLGVNIFVAGGRGAGWCDTLAASGVAGYVHWSSSRSDEEAQAIARSPGFLGWMHGDEPDNPEVINDVFYITRRPPERLQEAYDEMKASSTPAPMYLNLGQGLANGLAQSTPDSVYPAFCRTADIVCYDVYPTSTQERGTERLHLTARGVERLRDFAGPDKPLWIWLECTNLNGSRSRRGNRAPLPHELRAEIWMSIVHGADGIGYFPHQFNPYRGGPAAIPAPVKEEMSRTNGLLHTLAPLLRTGQMQRLATDTRSGQVSAASWRLGDQLLLVAVNMRSTPVDSRISLPDESQQPLMPLGTAPTRTGNGSLTLSLRPYEVALFVSGMEGPLDEYVHPMAPSPPAPTAAGSPVRSIDELPRHPDRHVEWSRTQTTRLGVPRLEQAPRLDGRLDDDTWKRAATLTSWTTVAGEGHPDLPTDGSIGLHGEHLYLSFRAEEPHLDSLVSRYRALWRNDCIELWFDPANTRTSFAHIIITADGRIETERTLPDHWGEGWRDEAWQPHIEVATGRTADAWTLEMSIPLQDLGVGDATGQTIGFDAARERKTRGGENSVWTRGGFRAAGDFGELHLTTGDLILADGVLRNLTPEAMTARVEVRISERRDAAPGAEWEQMWSMIAVEDRSILVPASDARGPGEWSLMETLSPYIPSGGLVSLTLRRPTGDQLEKFIAFVPGETP